MISKWVFLSFFFLTVLLSCQNSKPDIYKTKKGNYASKKGGFVASFPKEPTISKLENKVGNESFNIYRFRALKRPESYFNVWYVDYPDHLIKMWENKDNDLFHSILDNILALNQHLFLMTKEPLKNSQYEGVKFQLGSEKSKNYYNRGKIFMKQGRVYMVFFEGKDRLPSQENIKNFIQSFRTFD